MSKLAILDKITPSISMMGLKLKKYSPEILVVAGVVGTVVSTVMACKATTKVNDILEEAKADIDAVHEYSKTEKFEEKYSEDDAKKALALTYARTGLKLAKLYAPAVALGVLSITSILASNNIMRKRNVALAAAYATIDRSFKDYRNRVIERFGAEIDKELKYNIQTKKFEETVVDEKTGKEKKVKNTVKVAGIDGYSEYARFFDEGSRCYEKDAESNLYFLRAQQAQWNDKLKARGYVMLNEVYDALDIPQTKAGACVGWVYDPCNDNLDNYIDFGIYDINREKARDFVNGYERVILLDFNVEGDILDLIEKYQRR